MELWVVKFDSQSGLSAQRMPHKVCLHLQQYDQVKAINLNSVNNVQRVLKQDDNIKHTYIHPFTGIKWEGTVHIKVMYDFTVMDVIILITSTIVA